MNKHDSIALLEESFYKIISNGNNKFAAGNNASLWQEALRKIEEAAKDPGLVEAISKAASSSEELKDSLEKIQDSGISQEDISKATSLGFRLPGVVTASGDIDIDQFNKVAEIVLKFDKLPKSQQIAFLKFAKIDAQDFFQKNGSYKYRGGFFGRVIPVIGLIFSAYFAVKSLLLAFSAYRDLCRDSEKLGLSWFETLDADKISRKTIEVMNDPVLLGDLGVLCQYAIKFLLNGVSSVANVLDFFKDIGFFILEILLAPTGPLNLATIGMDIGLSIFLAILDYKVGQDVIRDHSTTLDSIVYVIKSNISSTAGTSDASLANGRPVSTQAIEGKPEEDFENAFEAYQRV